MYDHLLDNPCLLSKLRRFSDIIEYMNISYNNTKEENKPLSEYSSEDLINELQRRIK